VGSCPLGYRYVPAAGDRQGYIEVVREEAALVQRIFGLYAGGARMFQIAKQLSDERVPTKTDRDGISRRKTRAYGIWSVSAIARILKNETYHTGALPWNHYQRIEPDNNKRRGPKNLKNPRTARRIRDQSEWLSIPVPPIIDANTFTGAQTQITVNKAKNKRRRSHEYLFLCGRMTCFCGRAMTGYCDSKGVRRYRCNSKTDTISAPCRGVPRADTLEDVIWSALTELLDLLKDPVYLKEYIDQKIAKATQGEDQIRQRLVSVTKQIADYSRKQQVLLDRHLDGSIDAGLFRETMARLREESFPLEKLRDELQDHLSPRVPTEEYILSTSAHVEKILEHLAQATLAEKQEVLEAIDVRVVRQNDGAYRITFDLPKDTDNDHIKSGSIWLQWNDPRSTPSARCTRSSRP
jgi:site-specific DNA recombinase